MTPASPLTTVRTVAGLRAQVAVWRGRGETLALVPTMGALHRGHMALVDAAAGLADHTVASLFVNPRQFAEGEDFGSYPRDEDRDRGLLAAAGVAVLFAPEHSEIYPPGHSTSVTVGPLGEDLEGLHRPGFFVGVATVVAKLLLQCLPDVALFGEKDYQQLQVIRRLVRDLDIPVRIEAVPTVRDADGLALSSRNAYLSTSERAAAPVLHQTLADTADACRRGAPIKAAAAAGIGRLLQAGFASVDYLVVRDADSLAPIDAIDRPARVLAAATLGRARLIDNIAVG